MTTKNELSKMIENPETLIDFIVSLIGEDFEGTVGLRGLYENEGIGKLRNSSVWEDGNMTDEELDGTCVVGLSTNWSEDGYKELESAIQQYASEVFKYDMYGNARVGLVVGKAYADYGNDYWSNEVIVEEAKVIYIWE